MPTRTAVLILLGCLLLGFLVGFALGYIRLQLQVRALRDLLRAHGLS